MNAEDGWPSSATSFADRRRAAQARDGAQRRIAWAITMLCLAILLVIAVAAFDGGTGVTRQYVTVTNGGTTRSYQISPLGSGAPFEIRGDSLRITSVPGARSVVDLVQHEPGWTAAAVSLLLIPLWFRLWRRKRLFAGRSIGAVWSTAAALSVCALVCTAPAGTTLIRDTTFAALVVAGALFAAAFIVAPTPPDPDAINALKVRGLVRRHRASI